MGIGYKLLLLNILLYTSAIEASPFINNETIEEVEIVSYFAEWCKPCRKEATILNDLSKNGVAIAGVNFDQDSDKRTYDIAKSLEINYPVYKQGEFGPIKLPLPPVLPTTYILSRGEVVGTLYGEQSYSTLVEALKETKGQNK